MSDRVWHGTRRPTVAWGELISELVNQDTLIRPRSEVVDTAYDSDASNAVEASDEDSDSDEDEVE